MPTLASQGLTQSKDLQLAIWLLEPLARLDGFAGVATGLIVLRRMLIEYWEWLYPALDPEEADPAVVSAVVARFRRQAAAADREDRSRSRRRRRRSGCSTTKSRRRPGRKKGAARRGLADLERFEEALQNSTLPHLENMLGAILTCQTELAALQTAADQRFNGPDNRGEPLSLLFLKETFANRHWLRRRARERKREAQGGGQPGRPVATGGGQAVTIAAG